MSRLSVWRCPINLSFTALVVFLLSSLPIVAGAVVANPTRAPQAWPTLNLPEGLSTFAIGEQVIANGMPMRMTGFVSPRKPAELSAAFRRSLGEPVVETQSNGKRVLGRAKDNFYITVQIEAGDDGYGGSAGTIAISDMEAVSKGQDQYRSDKARWLDRLPPGSSITSETVSNDNGRSGRHMVVTNMHSEAVNREAVIALLKTQGYVLEREIRADPATARKLPANMIGAVTLYLKGTDREAMAIITSAGEKTLLVINTVATLQAYK